MRIAYLGPAYGTSLHRAHALERLGHEVVIVDAWAMLPPNRWMARWLHHAGGAGLSHWLNRRIGCAIADAQPDLIWVNQGEFLGPGLLRKLRPLQAPIVNYTIDDPYGGRDGRRFAPYLKAQTYYDLVAVVREPNVSEATQAGARHVIHVYRSADEVAHRPRELTETQRQHFASDVAFIGTWMPERGPFMVELIRQGVPLSIWGDRWHKAPEWPQLAPHWRGPGLTMDDDYAAAILASKVSLGLLSKGNRDLHTTRSLEIPALGGLLCAERTSEHLAIYEEGSEAVFWSDAAECAEQCRALLADEPRRRAIAAAGHARAQRNGHYNEQVMAKIIAAVLPDTEPASSAASTFAAGALG